MSSPSNPLSDREGEVLLATVAGLAIAQMPLAAGLRAASRESRGRLSQALRAIADQVARGQTIEQICGEEGSALPSHLRGLVSAAARTGQLGTALEEVVGHQRAARALRTRLLGSLVYPVSVLMLNGMVVAFLLGWVVPVFKQMFLEFGLQLPIMTQMVLDLGDAISWLIVGPGLWGTLLFLGFATALFVSALSGHGVWVQRTLVDSLPLIGALAQWAGAANFFQLLSVLLDKQIPLGESLRLAADGTRKADLRQSGYWLAEQVRSGESLSQLVDGAGCWPAGGTPWIRWGERHNSLSAAFRTLSELYRQRAQQRADWLRTSLSPVIFVLVGLSVGIVVISLFMPLVSLIQALS